MKLGTNEPKKVAFLVVLAAAAGYLVYSNLLSSPSQGVVNPAAALRNEPVEAPPRPPRPAARGGSQSDEFHPVLHPRRPEDRIDLSKVDPTLRLDLLAKLQVEPSPTARNLFQFGAPPAAAALKGPEPKVLPRPIPVTPAASTAVPLGTPQPASIPLKYYGFTAAPGNSPKTAFFLDGDEILVAKEGDMLKRRYRVVRISPNTVVMEDTQSKSEQTLHMEDMPG